MNSQLNKLVEEWSKLALAVFEELNDGSGPTSSELGLLLELIKGRSSRLAMLSTRLKGQVEQLTAQRAGLEAARVEAERGRRKAEEQMKMRQEELEWHVQESTQLSAAVARKSDHIERLSAQMATIKAGADQWQEQLTAVLADKDLQDSKLKRAEQDLDVARAMLQEKALQINQFESLLELEKKGHAASRASAAEQIRGLEDQLLGLKELHRSVAAQLKSEGLEQNQRREQVEAELQKVRLELEGSRARLTEQAAAHAEQMTQQRAQASELGLKLSSMQQLCEQYSAQCDFYQAELSRLKAQDEDCQEELREAYLKLDNLMRHTSLFLSREERQPRFKSRTELG